MMGMRLPSVAVAAMLLAVACTPAGPPSAATVQPSVPTAAAKLATAAPAAAATVASAAKPVATAVAQAAPTVAAVAPTVAAAAAKPAATAIAQVAPAVAKPVGSPTKVKVALPANPPSITVIGVYYALENGFFDEEGLEVEVLPLGSSVNGMRGLLAREADIALVGGANPFDARSNGAPIKIIASPVEKGTDEIVARSDIDSLADLNGKRWGLNTPNEPIHFAAKALAQRNGVNPDSIEFLAIGAVADRVRALLNDRVDVAAFTLLILQPVHDAIESGELKVLTSMAREFPDLPLAYSVTRDDIVQTQPEMLARFVKAEIKGYRWAQDHPEEAATIAEKYIKDVDHALMTRGTRRMSELGVYGLNGGITEAGVERTQQLLVDQGALTRKIPTNEILELRFVEQALRDLGTVSR